MILIDRYILARFFVNFALLFTLLFLFAVAIDLAVALEDFVDAARIAAGDDAGMAAVLAAFTRMAVSFQSPRFFQFFAYLHGLVAIGAMGFTLAQMHRHRELVALLSAGLGMHRIAMPFVVGMFALSIVQLGNQEFILPRVATLLLRDHGQIGQRTIEEFALALTPDGSGNLFQSPRFDPARNELFGLTILERDERGRTRRRVTAERAVWTTRAAADAPGEARGEAPGEGWSLTDGRAVVLREVGREGAIEPAREQPVDFFETDLSPRVITVQRYGQYAAMLSLRQIGRMLDTPGVSEQASLQRFRYGRFASVLVNILLMWLTLPAFLLREPANLLGRTVLCAGIAIPAMLTVAVFMMVDLPGIPPAVGVFLPVIVLIPVVLAQWTFVKT